MKETLSQLAILSAGGKQAVKLGVAMPPIHMGSDKKAAKDIQKASAAFYRALKKQNRKLPGLGDWAYFNAFKSLASFQSYQKVCPADHLYYKEKAEYFYPLKGHYFRRLIGKLFSGLMQSTFKLMVKED